MPQPQNRRTEAFEIRTLAAGLSALVLLLTLDLERDVTRNNREAARLRLAVAAGVGLGADAHASCGALCPPFTLEVRPALRGRRGLRRHAGGRLDAPRVDAVCFLVSFMNFDRALLAPPGTGARTWARRRRRRSSRPM